MRLCSPFKPGGLLSACLRDRRIERPCLLALVILVEDLCGRVSACYNEGMVTPVIAHQFLLTNKHSARGTIWKRVGMQVFPGTARPTPFCYYISLCRHTTNVHSSLQYLSSLW